MFSDSKFLSIIASTNMKYYNIDRQLVNNISTLKYK